MAIHRNCEAIYDIGIVTIVTKKADVPWKPERRLFYGIFRHFSFRKGVDKEKKL